MLRKWSAKPISQRINFRVKAVLRILVQMLLSHFGKWKTTSFGQGKNGWGLNSEGAKSLAGGKGFRVSQNHLRMLTNQSPARRENKNTNCWKWIIESTSQNQTRSEELPNLNTSSSPRFRIDECSRYQPRLLFLPLSDKFYRG